MKGCDFLEVIEWFGSLLEAKGVDSSIVIMFTIIVVSVIFSLKNYDKSEYELLLSNYFSKLLVSMSKMIPVYVLIFLLTIFLFDWKTNNVTFVDGFFITFIITIIMLILHFVLMQFTYFTRIKYDYYITIEGKTNRSKIVKMINNELLLIENEDTKKNEYTTKWKDREITREIGNVGKLRDIYVNLNKREAFKLSGLILLITFIIIFIAIVNYNNANVYSLVFFFLGIIGLLNTINIWINYFVAKALNGL